MQLGALQEGNGHATNWQIRFQVPKDLAPVTIGFELEVQTAGQPAQLLSGAHGSHFAVPIGMPPGCALHQGAAEQLTMARQSSPQDAPMSTTNAPSFLPSADDDFLASLLPVVLFCCHTMHHRFSSASSATSPFSAALQLQGAAQYVNMAGMPWHDKLCTGRRVKS